ncbi:hypothetical protein D3C76_1725670 [compost metagenome]
MILTLANAWASSAAGPSSKRQWEGTLTARRLATPWPRLRALAATSAMAASLPAMTIWLSLLRLARYTSPPTCANKRSTLARSRPLRAVMP